MLGAAIFQPVFNHTCKSIIDVNLSRLDKISNLSKWIIEYKTLSCVAMDIKLPITWTRTTTLGFEDYGLSITSVPVFISSIHILHTDGMNVGDFKHEDPLEELIYECPVD